MFVSLSVRLPRSGRTPNQKMTSIPRTLYVFNYDSVTFFNCTAMRCVSRISYFKDEYVKSFVRDSLSAQLSVLDYHENIDNHENQDYHENFN